MARVAGVVTNHCAPDPRVLREARWLVEAGHEVTVHAFDRLENLPQEEFIDGVRIIRHRVGLTPYGGTWQTARGIRKYRKALVEVIQGVDLIHCHDADTLPVGMRIGTIPVLFDMHDLHHTWIMMPNPRSLFRRIIADRYLSAMLRDARKASAVITSSEGFQSWLAERGITSSVVENRPERRAALPQAEGFTVGYLGRIREQASFQFLLRAVKLISEEDRPRLLIAGDGTQSTEVANMVRAAVTEGWLDAEVFGSFDDDQLAEMMTSVSVMYAMYPPDRGNIVDGALPVKMFEAASFGRPTVVNRGVPMGDLCESENLGRAVEWGDAQALATALQELNGTSVQLRHDAGRERGRFLGVVESLL